MAWSAVVVTATGDLVSVGTVVAGRIDPLHEVIPLAREPDWSSDLWDATLRTLVPRPPPPPPIDRVPEILNDSLLVMRASDKPSLQAVLERRLADVRFR